MELDTIVCVGTIMLPMSFRLEILLYVLAVYKQILYKEINKKKNSTTYKRGQTENWQLTTFSKCTLLQISVSLMHSFPTVCHSYETGY